MDFPDRGRSYRRLCNCGTTIIRGTFCDTCYDNQSLRQRFRHSRREWQKRRTWTRTDARPDERESATR